MNITYRQYLMNYCQVHSDHCLEEEWLEVICGVANNVEEDGRHVDRHEGTFNFIKNQNVGMTLSYQ